MTRTPKRSFSINHSEYPFKSHWFERNGSYLHYLDEGKGIPVLMLHGSPTWSFLFRKIIKELDGCCRTIAPDLPGFGFSDHPANFDFTPQAHAEWVNELIDRLTLDRFILLVHEWGGPIGMSIAASRPDQVAGLVIVNTWSWKPDNMMWRAFSTLFGSPLGKYLILKRNLLINYMLPTMFYRSEVKSLNVLKAYGDPFPTADSRLGLYAFPRALNNSDAWFDSIESRLHHLSDKPVELIIGEKDPFFAKEDVVLRWQKHFPCAQINRISDAGHLVEEDRPHHVVEAIWRILGKRPS